MPLSHQYKIEPPYGLPFNCVEYITMLGNCDWNSDTLWIELKIRQKYSCHPLNMHNNRNSENTLHNKMLMKH